MYGPLEKPVYSVNLRFVFSALENAPVLYTVVPTSARSLELEWTAPDTDKYTGEILYYQVCYQKSSISNDINCTLESVDGNLIQAVMSGMHPFQEYRVKIRGVVALGYGLFSNVLMSTTAETGR